MKTDWITKSKAAVPPNHLQNERFHPLSTNRYTLGFLHTWPSRKAVPLILKLEVNWGLSTQWATTTEKQSHNCSYLYPSRAGKWPCVKGAFQQEGLRLNPYKCTYGFKWTSRCLYQVHGLVGRVTGRTRAGHASTPGPYQSSTTTHYLSVGSQENIWDLFWNLSTHRLSQKFIDFLEIGKQHSYNISLLS